MATSPPQPARGLKFLLRALGSRNYRLFFLGQGVSLIGTWMQRVAMSWLIYDLTKSAFLLGFIGFLSMLPTFLVSPIAGVLIDRWSRHRVIVITQVLAMLQAFVLAGLVLTGTLTAGNVTWVLIILSVYLGTVQAFDMPARQSFIVEMVERRDDLPNAIALNSSMFNGARLIGPTVAGVTVAAVGTGVCFLINAISFLAVLAALLAMRVAPPVPRPQRRVWHELTEGFRYAFGFAPIRAILLLIGWTSLVSMPYGVLMPIFATQVFHGDARTLGYLIAAPGVGALLGAMYLASRRSVVGLGRVIVVAAAAFGLSLLGFAVTTNLFVALGLLVVTGVGMMIQMAASNTVLQTLVEDHRRGRVMAFYAMTFAGMAPFGSLLAGSLGQALGAQTTVALSGVGCLLAAGVFLLSLPGLHRLGGPIYAPTGFLANTSGAPDTPPLPTPPED
jgi:MFS family permease